MNVRKAGKRRLQPPLPNQLFGIAFIVLIEHFFIHTVELLARQHREKLPAEIERFLNGAVLRIA